MNLLTVSATDTATTFSKHPVLQTRKLSIEDLAKLSFNTWRLEKGAHPHGR